MLKGVKTWIADKKIRLSNNIDNPIATTEKKTITDQVKKYKQPFSQLQSSSMYPHDSLCDIVGCNKNPCFIWESDRIISKEYEVKSRKQ